MDAGYFWVQLGHIIFGTYTSRTQITVDYSALRQILLAEVAKQFPDCDLLRIYWYDGPGASDKKTAEHVAIEKLDVFKLRLGTRTGAGAQKGVDGLIIADLISLTQQKAITNALLITGDSDIAPGVIAAQGMGLRVHLLSFGPEAATSPYLAAEMDFKCFWGTAEAASFASAITASVSGGAAPAVPASASVPSVPAPAPVPSTSAPTAATLSQADLAAIASGAYVQMQSGALATQLPTLATAHTAILPQDINAALLGFARKYLARNLDATERKQLRSEFRKLL